MNIFDIDKDLINRELNKFDSFEQNIEFREHMMRILSLLYKESYKTNDYEVRSEIKELEEWAKDFLNKYDIINHDWLLKNIDVNYKFSTPTDGGNVDHYTVSVSKEICVVGIDKLYELYGSNASNDTIKNIAKGIVINKFANCLINPQLYADKEYIITSISFSSIKDSDTTIETKTIVQSEEFAKMLKLLNDYEINTYDKLKEVLDSKIKEVEE